ncbi:MAG: type VI secretion system tip protein VgrG [Candidatus Zixiibacteriota bacterium]
MDIEALDANVARYTFSIQDVSDELRVTSFTGTEGISQLFHFTIELACDNSELDLDSILGKPAQFDMAHPTGTRRMFGLVSHMEQGVSGETFTPYTVEFVPALWLFTQRFNSRIFQEKSVPEIIEQVLTDGGTTSDRFRFALQGTYEPREYCVQYRESDWNFISRLLEEEGIFYFFEHGETMETLVMADSHDAVVAIDGDSTVVYRDPSGGVEAAEFVFNFRYSQRLRPGRVMLHDFNFEQPTLNLVKEEESEHNPELGVYDHPGNYMDQTLGEQRARVRLEAAQSRRRLGQGRSNCMRMLSGYDFTLADYTRSSLNQTYLLISVHHTGTQPLGQDEGGGRFHYSNHFKCIPSTVPFRPLRVTPKPVVEGSQTALVVGPDNELVHVDEHGRVKVQFFWDREGQFNENSSCWIRVSQLWAGFGWGAMFIPRIGHEVIVDFLEGDPDRPIIIGRVYNGFNQPPYPLDDEKMKSTIKSANTRDAEGSNEIRFEDTQGSEQIYVHAQKDLSEIVEHDRTRLVKNDEKVTIEKSQTISVGEGGVGASSGGKYAVKSVGDATIDSDANIAIKAAASASMEAAGGNLGLTASAVWSAKGATATIDGGASLSQNATVIILDGATISINGAGSAIVDVGGSQVAVVPGVVTVKGAAAVNIDGGGSAINVTPGEIKMSSASIKLSGGGGSLVLDGSGASLSGPLVKIN